MKKNVLITLHIIVCCLLITFVAHAEQKLHDVNSVPSTASDNTSVLSMHTFAAAHHAPTIFLGMKKNDTTSTDNYALCKLDDYTVNPHPYAQQLVIRNLVPDSENLFFNKNIELLTLMEGINEGLRDTPRPVIVTKEHPQLIQLAGIVRGKLNVFTTALNDAHPDTPAYTRGIIAIAATNKYIFAAVKPQDSDIFGDSGSGIGCVLLARHLLKPEETASQGDDVVMPIFQQLDAPTGTLTTQPVTRSVPLDRSAQALILPSHDNNRYLSSLGQQPVLHWDETLQRLFIGITNCSSEDSTAGTRSLLVAQPTDKGLLLRPIAPDEAFNTIQTCPIGMRGAYTRANIHHLTVMHTSTNLSYLIIVGGIGAPDQTSRSVYALPLVTSPDAAIHGTIAARDIEPHNIFNQKKFFHERQLAVAATQEHELPTITDPAVCVGYTTLPTGTITHVTTSGDVVYITIADEGQYPHNASGAFYSRALFHANGTIKGWSQWQRVTPLTAPILGIVAHHASGSLTTFSSEDQQDAPAVTAIRKTAWPSSSEQPSELAAYINKEFATSAGGILHAQDFPYATNGLGGCSLFITGAIGKIVIAQTGNTHGEYRLPQEHYANAETIIALQDNELKKIGAITSCAIASDARQSWLIVGGVNGAAILTSEHNTGWYSSDTESQHLLPHLQTCSFKKFGSYKAIKKIITDDNYLYILTDTQLDRIAIDASSFNAQTFKSSLVTTATAQMCDRFFDIIISGKIALLATNKHVLRIANNHDIRTAVPHDQSWVRLPIYASIGPVTQFEAVTSSGIITDYARGIGSVVHMLNANRATNESQLIRFSVKGLTEQDTIDDTTVLPLADLFKEDTIASILHLGTFRSICATNGAHYMFGNNGNNHYPCQLLFMPGAPTTTSGRRIVTRTFKHIPLGTTHTATLNALGTISAHGSWFAAGSFGMRIQE